MNATRKKEIQDARVEIEILSKKVRTLSEEEGDFGDENPNTIAGQKANDVADTLSEAADNLLEAADLLAEIADA